jgi:hypothetical protein
MIDWYIIQYLYPESYKMFVDRMFPNVGIISVSILDYYDIKKLYGFFDNEGIFLNLEMYCKDHWGFTISLHNGSPVCQGHNSGANREEIECDGFVECFRILEKIIKDNF